MIHVAMGTLLVQRNSQPCIPKQSLSPGKYGVVSTVLVEVVCIIFLSGYNGCKTISGAGWVRAHRYWPGVGFDPPDPNRSTNISVNPLRPTSQGPFGDWGYFAQLKLFWLALMVDAVLVAVVARVLYGDTDPIGTNKPR